MTKQFWGVVAAVIIILVGVFVITNHKSSAPGSKSTNSAQLTSHVTGEGKKGVTLVEYGDYECPACYSYEPATEQVRQQYAQDITFQFRNYPITSRHPNAFAGARAAEAAALQDKFWEMHDLLYKNQDPQGQAGWVASSSPLDNYFVPFAKQLGLDTTKFKQDFASSKVNGLINADMAEGNRLGVAGTPAFFLDGKQIQINSDFASFQKAIDAEIAKKAPSTSSQTQQ